MLVNTSRKESVEAMVVSPNRYSVFLLCGLLVQASSFSTLSGPGPKHSNPHRVCIPSAPHQYGLLQQRSDSGFRPTCRSPLTLAMSSPATTTGDSQMVRDLFSKYCDEDSLVDRKILESMSPFADMLAEEDLMPEELDEIWEAAPKASGDSSRVDVHSFVKIYNEVDDLFEDDEEEDDDDIDTSGAAAESETSTEESNKNELDEELSKAYESLCDDKGLISKEKMMQWEEIQSLFEENLLEEAEFEELWKNTANSENALDVSGFTAFNLGLDDLFDFEDDDDDNGDDDEQLKEATTKQTTPVRTMIVEGDNPPGVLFSQLADTNYLVGMEELKLWSELTEYLDDGDLLESELQEIYDKYATPESSGKLTEEGFVQLYDEIDELFEEVVDDDDEEDAEDAEETSAKPPMQQQSPPMNTRVKEDLLAFIDLVIEDDEEPCGFGTTEADQQQILNIVQVLEQQPTNIIVQKEGNVDQFDIAGTWELIYTSSSAMKFNQGLSGIGGSFPNGSFGGLRQELKATKYIRDMEYKERVEVNPTTASFDVTINGLWDLEKSVSLFSGQPTIILDVEPDKVRYGLTSTRADHWKSLGPVNRLDVSYLDHNLRVMRGCTSADTLFVFKKIKSN